MKGILIVTGIFLVGTIFVGGYFLTQNTQQNDLAAQKISLDNDLAMARLKLTKEKKILETMTDDLRDSFPLGSSVQDQMKEGSKIVNQTNFLFANPNGANPELTLKKTSATDRINKQRIAINAILADWKNKTSISYIEKIDAKESEQIKKEAETIKAYIQELSNLIGTLTPKNSGISQAQIDSYKASLPPVDSIDEVLTSIESAIADSKKQIPNTETENTSAEDVIAQQQVVDQAQEEVDILEEKIAEVQKQIDQSKANYTPASDDTGSSGSQDNSNITPDSNSADTVTNNTNSSTDTSGNNSNGGNNNSNNPEPSNTTGDTSTTSNTNNDSSEKDKTIFLPDEGTGRVFDKSKYQGIIIQPGPAQLIQGDNQF